MGGPRSGLARPAAWVPQRIPGSAARPVGAGCHRTNQGKAMKAGPDQGASRPDGNRAGLAAGLGFGGTGRHAKRCLHDPDRACRTPSAASIDRQGGRSPIGMRVVTEDAGRACEGSLPDQPHRARPAGNPHRSPTAEGESRDLGCGRSTSGCRLASQPMAGRPGRHPYQGRLVKRAPSCHLQPQRRKRVVIAHWLTRP